MDNATLKLGYDLTPTLSLAYTLGFFQNNDSAGIQTYLRNAAGGARLRRDRQYRRAGLHRGPPAAFSGDRYQLIEDHLMQSLSLGSHTGGVFDWSAIATVYDYAKGPAAGARHRLPRGGRRRRGDHPLAERHGAGRRWT